jgi:hypothetical protein
LAPVPTDLVAVHTDSAPVPTDLAPVSSITLFGFKRKEPTVPEYRVRRSESTESLPEVIESLADAVAGTNLATRRRILESATRGQRLLCGYYFYWDDVTNGGHWQYFSNYTGNLWSEALEATKVLRLPEGKILRDALALFPDKQPGLTQRERREQLARISRAKLDKLDECFYALSGDDKRIRQYIDEHPEEFFLPERRK